MEGQRYTINIGIVAPDDATAAAVKSEIESNLGDVLGRGRLREHHHCPGEAVLHGIALQKVPGGLAPETGGEAPANAESSAVATTDEYFGGCPTCGKCEAVLNIERTHWHVCHTHKVKWCVGSNLFSSWRDEDETVWSQNAEVLKGYDEVEPIRSPEREAPGSRSGDYFDTAQFLAGARGGRYLDQGLKDFVERAMLQSDFAAMKAAEAAVIEWQKHDTGEIPF